MIDNSGHSKYPYYFLALYALNYAGNAIYNTFIPVYLDHLGFNQASIGTLLAMSPFIALVAQPVWGMAGDRAKSKNSILKILLAGCALAVLTYPISGNFYYLSAVIAVFTFFQTSISPIADAVTLERIELTRWKFGPIRLAGTLGYAFMSVIAGTVARQNITSIFTMYFAVTAFAFLTVFRVPAVKGHQSEGIKVSVWKLFKNRELTILMLMNFIMMLTIGFYYSFFSIYYKHLGADSAMLGWAMFLSAASEIPFLLFSNKILDRIGVKATLLLSILVSGIRWLLLHYITDVYAILAVSLMHGMTFIVFAYSMATFINKNVQKELRASGQTINGLIGLGLARIIASVTGGFLSDAVGIKQVFLYTAAINFAAVAAFGALFIISYYKAKPLCRSL